LTPTLLRQMTVSDTTKKPMDESGIVEGNEPTTVPATTSKLVVETTDANALPPVGAGGAEGNDPAIVLDTTKKLIVKTGGEEPANEGDVGDESSASSEPLSVSADDDFPSGDESQEVKSGSGNSTTTETSEDEEKDPSYVEATPVEEPSYRETPALANIISQSQTTVPTVVP
jgi:hypothetical protein